MQLGYGERAGSGADVIVKGWTGNNWEMPIIEERVQPDETTLTLVVGASTTSNLKAQDPTLGMSDVSQTVLSLSQALSQVVI